jgi:protein O-GlcNAc transferase
MSEPFFLARKIKKRAKQNLPTIPPNKLKAIQLVYDGYRYNVEGNDDLAEKAWRSAAETDADCVPAWTFLTDYLTICNRFDEAFICLERLISLRERTAPNLWILAGKSCAQKRFSLAEQLLADALTLNPSPQTLYDIRILQARIDFAEKRWIKSIEGATGLIEADPECIEALQLRQSCYFELGWAQEDVADSRRLIQLQPDNTRHSKILFKINYLRETTPESLYEDCRIWNEMYASPLAAEIKPFTNRPDPERPLKVGYLSPDLRHHPIMKLLPAVFENHDNSNLEVFAYSIGKQKDELTQYVQKTVGNFIELPVSKNAIADRVRADGIDVLVDLAGHTMDGEALLAFALKPAPVQVSWLGVLSTTGLTTMDYFIGDPYMPCPGTEHLFSEKVYRLKRPTGCYRAVADPGIAPSPYFSNGYITFGCFNDPHKITRDVIRVWAVILHFHPTSKLFLKYTHLHNQDAQRRLRDWLWEDGIPGDRLQFAGGSPPFDYMAAFNQIDIAFDPFPYNGGTTTLDAMFMGVPVVSVSGRLPVSCSGAGLLPQVGLPVAESVEQYVALAGELARTIPIAPGIRKQISDAMKKSAFMDEEGLVRDLETAYRYMWREWCARQKLDGDRLA